MRAHLADSFSMRLPHAFDEENFDFYGRKLTGTPEQQARWKRCVQGTDGSLGEALGKLYAAQYFTPDMKASTLSEVHDIEAAMGKDIDDIDWMSPDTKVKAKEKLHAVADKIGYPDKWRDYSKLDIKAGDALGNSMRSREFEVAYQLNKIGKPVNRQEWQMTPPTVNAYYDPSMNDINFPAGILQPAFYDKDATDATNYGHIGAVVGHELTHGFDDQARSSTPTATSTTGGRRKTRSNSKRRPAASMTNTADSPPSTTSRSTANSPSAKTPPIMAACASPSSRSDGAPRIRKSAHRITAEQQAEQSLSPQQQFFLGYAQNWCTNERPEFLRMLAQVDPHSPDALRVRGVIVNMPEFAHCFRMQSGSAYGPG
jgi:putative endopeptidase